MSRVEQIIDYIIKQPVDEWVYKDDGLYIFNDPKYNFILKVTLNWDTDAGGTHDRHSITIIVRDGVTGEIAYETSVYIHISTDKTLYEKLYKYMNVLKDVRRNEHKNRENKLFEYIEKASK